MREMGIPRRAQHCGVLVYFPCGSWRPLLHLPSLCEALDPGGIANTVAAWLFGCKPAIPLAFLLSASFSIDVSCQAKDPLQRALAAFPVLYGGSVAVVLALILLKAQATHVSLPSISCSA